MNTPRRLHALTGVWGRPHVERWARTSLATQISAGNLPALAARGVPIDYHVFTAAEDAPLVESLAAPLARYGRLRVHPFETTMLLGRSFRQHFDESSEAQMKRVADIGSAYWVTEAACAEGGDPAVALLTNDLLFSDGALARAWDRLQQGAKALMVPVLRLATERTAALGEQLAGLRPGGPGIDARSLCAALLDGLHSMSERFRVDHPSFSGYPTSVLWRVGDEGWLCRSFMPHPLMAVPVAGRWYPESTVDYIYAQSLHRGEHDLCMPGPDDDIVVLKRTPEGTYDERQRPPVPLSPERMARFLYFFTSREHRALARQPVRFPVRLDPGKASLWDDAEARTRAQLDGWYDHLDVRGCGIDLRASGTEALWHASHHASIRHFLCPGRVKLMEAERPEVAQIYGIAQALLGGGDVRHYLSYRGLAYTAEPASPAATQ